MDKPHSVSSNWFLAGIAIIPFVYSTTGIDPAFTLRAILLSVLTIVTIFATRKQPIRTSPLLWVWCVYAAFNIVSIAVAQNSGEAIYQASIVLLYGAWLFAAMQMMTKEILPSLLRTIAIIGFAVSFISLFQFFDLGFGFIPGREIPCATMTTKNLMTSFLFLTLPATSLVAVTDKKIWRFFGLVSLTTSVFVILIAQTRSVWLGCMVAGLVAIGLFMLSKHRKMLWERYRGTIRNPIIAISACLVIVFVFNFPPRSAPHEVGAVERANSIMNYATDTSAILRFQVWKESFSMFMEHPFLGVGAGNWKIELPKYGLENFSIREQSGRFRGTEPHNDFVAAFCESGLGGGLSFVAVFACAFLMSVRFITRKADNMSGLILAILLVAAIAGYAVISFIDFPNSRIEHSMLMMILLGMIPTTSREKTSIPNPFVFYAVSCVIIPALLLSLFRFRAEIHEKNILQGRINHDWNAVISECNKIYSPRLLSLDGLSTPLIYYKAEAEFMQEDYDAALRDNLMALKAHPNHFYTLNNTGSSYIKMGNFSDGEVFYRKALAISPYFEESLLNLASVYFNQNKFDSAFECVRKCDTSQEGSRAQKLAMALWNKHR